MGSFRAVFKVAVVVAALTVGLSGCSPEAKPAKSVPANGIVLVTVDGWWDPTAGVDPYTAESLPRAIRFSDAMTPCPEARPAVVSILTGQTPDRTGIRDNLTRPLPTDVPYLPELIAKNDWQTAAFVSSPWVGNGSGLERGFAVFDAPRELMFGPFRFNPMLRPADELIKNFSTWSKGLPADRPFFAWIHLAYGGPSTTSAGTAPPSAADSWQSLATVLSEAGRLADATVIVVGVSGKVDAAVAETSGYFLVPSVLRVPMLYRPAKGSDAGAWDAGAPRVASDLASVIAKDAGVAAVFPDAVSPADRSGTPRVRFAWTWSAAREFEWPVQGAAVRNDALFVSEGQGASSSVVSWSSGEALPASDADGLAAALFARPPWVEERTQKGPTLPPDLVALLTKANVSIPQAKILPPQSSLRERLEVIPLIFKAREEALHPSLGPSTAAFEAVTNKDPGNAGAWVEAGQFLALLQRPIKARERLDAALSLYPYNAEGWHWLSHVALQQKEFPKADAMLQLSNFIVPDNADVLYDLACASSLLGNPTGAESYLRKAWDAGYRDADHIERDNDLRNLRADPRYARFMQDVAR